MMGKVVNLRPGDLRIDLVGAYLYGIAAGFEAVRRKRAYHETDTQVMCGYLAAAVVAFRIAGDEPMASRLEGVANRIDKNWRCFEKEIRDLCDFLSQN